MKKISFLLILSGMLSSLTAAEPFAHWQKISTEHFTFIFEEENREATGELLTYCEEVYDNLSRFFNSRPAPVHCILNGRVDYANGMYAPFPDTITLNVSPPSLPYNMGPSGKSWLRMVFTHELTHYFHFSYPRGIVAFFSRIFGNDIKPAGTALVYMGWMFEGITIYLETMFTEGGRGRDLYFEMLYKAPVLAEKLFSPAQAQYSSDYPPGGRRIYVGGYILVDYLHRHYGEDIFIKIYDIYSRNPFFGPASAIKKATGHSYKEIFQGMKKELEDKFRKYKSLPEGKLLTPREWGDWNLPAVTEKEWFLYRRNKTDPPGIVRFDPRTGEERLIYQGTLQDYASLAADQDKVYFASTVYDLTPAYDLTGVNDLFVMDREGKHIRRITTGARVHHPAVYGETLVAVQRQGSFSRLVQVDKDSGEITPLLEIPGGMIYTPVFSPDGKRLAFVARTAGRQDIYLLELTGGPYQPEDARNLTGPDPAGDYAPFFLSPDTLIFVSDREKELALYEVNLPEDRFYRLLRDPVGITGAFPYQGELVYSTYTVRGFALKSRTPGEKQDVTFLFKKDDPAPLLQVPENPSSTAYTDVPGFMFWLPAAEIRIFGDSPGIIDLGAAFYGTSPLRTSHWMASGAYSPRYNQVRSALDWQNNFGKFQFFASVNQIYQDNTGPQYITPQFTQNLLGSLSLQYPLVGEHLLGKTQSLYLYGGVNYIWTLAGYTPFSYFNGGDLSVLDSIHRVYGSSGLYYTRNRSGSTLDFLGSTRQYLNLQARWPLLSGMEETPLITFTGYVSHPGLFRNQALRWGINSSYQKDSTRGVIFPRSFSTPLFQEGEGRLIPSLEWHIPLGITDWPFLWITSLLKWGVTLYGEGIFDYSLETPSITPEGHIFLGGELHTELGYAGGSQPFGMGINCRVDPMDPGSFAWQQDISLYILLSYDSFRELLKR